MHDILTGFCTLAAWFMSLLLLTRHWLLFLQNVQEWKKTIMAEESYFEEMSKYKITLARNISNASVSVGDTDCASGITGTFRKLNVDWLRQHVTSWCKHSKRDVIVHHDRCFRCRKLLWLNILLVIFQLNTLSKALYPFYMSHNLYYFWSSVWLILCLFSAPYSLCVCFSFSLLSNAYQSTLATLSS